ncbi:glycosyltransferase [Mesorhizobium sp. CAU 1741]|uniref:glycosyltransferase n=1 Tax=Mesorhizobium sp. CAU 1741 TaxID=3140366 RepID=UPI00325AFFED
MKDEGRLTRLSLVERGNDCGPDMRVLHFFKTYIPDTFAGIERVIWQIAEGSEEHGIRADVLSLSPSSAGIKEPLQVGRHHAYKARQDLHVASTGFSLSGIKVFADLAREADIVHYHFPWPYMDIAHFLARHGKPTVVTYHSDVVRQKLLLQAYKPLMHAFLKRVDRIVATSPNYVASSPVLKTYREKTSVIPIGLGPQSREMLDPAVVESWRARVGQDFFLFVGALRYYKGLGFLIDAARATGLPVVVVGEGEMGADLLAAGLPNLQLVGSVDDADRAALLELSRAFVFPSHLRSEAFGVALLEAARAGRPMISCEIGTGTSYVNKDGETGIVVPPADAAALGAAMQKLHQDRELARAMGAAAHERFCNIFSAEPMVNSYIALYRSLLPH